MPRNLKPEEIFYEQIHSLITNMFIDNPNLQNEYFINSSHTDIREDVQERARYILSKMESTKHLIDL